MSSTEDFIRWVAISHIFNVLREKNGTARVEVVRQLQSPPIVFQTGPTHQLYTLHAPFAQPTPPELWDMSIFSSITDFVTKCYYFHTFSIVSHYKYNGNCYQNVQNHGNIKMIISQSSGGVGWVNGAWCVYNWYIGQVWNTIEGDWGCLTTSTLAVPFFFLKTLKMWDFAWQVVMECDVDPVG